MWYGGIFWDLAKVFDCVNQEILLVKLHYYGIQGTEELIGSDPLWQIENKNLK
jgi:hypothetical protein